MKKKFLTPLLLASLGFIDIDKLRAAEVDTAATGIGYFVTGVTPSDGSKNSFIETISQFIVLSYIQTPII